jgi:glutamate 5-kinase
MKSNAYCNRLVIKIGSSILTDDQNHLDRDCVFALVRQMGNLIDRGKELVVVSSGAIACGLDILRLTKRPKQIDELAALASLGQISLMQAYQDAFSTIGKNCGQVLLTWDDFDKRSRFLHAKKTIGRLLEYKITAIINENDSVSTEEIKFGDNDKLSALVANLVCADLLIILTDVDGLHDHAHKKIELVEKVDQSILRLACPSKKFSCVGGMYTKLEAIKLANDSGIPAVLANGRKFDVLAGLLKQEAIGTYFCAGDRRLAKKNWIASGTKPKGVIIVDEGAKQAVKHKNRSLLGVGVVDAKGDFKEGDVVFVADTNGVNFAKGITGFSCRQIQEMKGKKNQKEIIHRNDLVII